MSATRGGSRPGSGRPKEPETKIITFRVRLHWEEHIRKVVNKEMEKLRKKDYATTNKTPKDD